MFLISNIPLKLLKTCRNVFLMWNIPIKQLKRNGVCFQIEIFQWSNWKRVGMCFWFEIFRWSHWKRIGMCFKWVFGLRYSNDANIRDINLKYSSEAIETYGSGVSFLKFEIFEWSKLKRIEVSYYFLLIFLPAYLFFSHKFLTYNSNDTHTHTLSTISRKFSLQCSRRTFGSLQLCFLPPPLLYLL